MNDDFAYLLAVVNCDGYVSRENIIGLNAIDREFVQAFADALGTLLGRTLELHQYSYPYGPQWRVIAGGPWLIELLNSASLDEIALEYPRPFLRGVFDSEGNLGIQKRGPHSYQPRYRIWNTNLDVLNSTLAALDKLGIHAHMTLAGRKGDRTVGNTVRLHDLYQIIWAGHSASRTWESLVGSSIPRKRYTGPGLSPAHVPRKYRIP